MLWPFFFVTFPEVLCMHYKVLCTYTQLVGDVGRIASFSGESERLELAMIVCQSERAESRNISVPEFSKESVCARACVCVCGRRKGYMDLHGHAKD